MFFNRQKKYLTVTLHDPSRSKTGFTNNNRLPVTIESGETVGDALAQFNKFRSPENQVDTTTNKSTRVTTNMEIVIY